MKQVLSTEITVEELRQLITEVVTECIEKKEPPKVNPIEDRMVTRKELKQILKVSDATIHNLMKKDKLRYHKFGRKVYFKLSEVYEYMDVKKQFEERFLKRSKAR
ncbi:MAG: helix-turn-helix domain-containing protein [bacterium]